jgi:hypothetical protein
LLVVTSSPREPDRLDAAGEEHGLNRALAGPVEDGLIELEWVSTPTWSNLEAVLAGQVWHALHFIGHGRYDQERDEGILALVNEDGGENRVSASQFAGLLSVARVRPRLVVLNTCASAATGQASFSGTGASLVRSGVTAVVAMQFRISDDAAVAFSNGFYTAIAHGLGVDEAVRLGRLAIVGLSPDTLEWITPVLYLRGENARLYSMSPGSPRKPGNPARKQGPQDDKATAPATSELWHLPTWTDYSWPTVHREE